MDKIVEFKNADALTRLKFVVDIAKFGLLTGIVGSSILSCKNEKGSENKTVSSAADSQGKNLKVAIIGAGIAGLNAAYQLKKAGIDAKVYEGSHRLGGRILTHYNDALQMGIHPEFGGDFIDSTHEDMLGLVKEFDLELIDMYAE